MIDIRLIVSDVDGTILPYNGRISEETRCAVRRCREQGVCFVMCSGRWFVAAKAVWDELCQDEGLMIISNGGAVVKTDGSIIKEWFMRPEDVRISYKIMLRHDVMITAFAHNSIYRINTRALKGRVPGYGEKLGEGYLVNEDDQQAFEEHGLTAPYRLEAYSYDKEILTILAEELRNAALEVSSSHFYNVDVMSRDMGKGLAVQYLANIMGITADQCMGFGDNLNDLHMLSVVGWPVAVGNAVDEVKKRARIIAPSCEENGVARIIKKYILK